MAKLRGYQGKETEKEVARLAGSIIDDLTKQLKEANEQIKYNEMAISFQKVKIQELEETISVLRKDAELVEKDFCDTRAKLGRTYKAIEHRDGIIEALRTELKTLAKEIK